MYATADPVYVELPVGQAARIAVTITNTGSVIDAYEVSTFGLDPEWVAVQPSRLSLFPNETGIVEATIALPDDFPAGDRMIAVHVRSENDPNEFSLAQVNLDVAERPRTSMRVDPTLIQGGNKAVFGLLVANEGNATIEVEPEGTDPEDRAEIEFDPPSIVLPPGHREVVRAQVKGGRPWFGQPKARVIEFGVRNQPTQAVGTFLQRPRIGRWLFSLLGLLAVAAVFAAVLSRTFDQVVDEAKPDDALLNAALDEQTAVGAVVPVTPASVTGVVKSASTDQPIAGVQADLFSNENGIVPLASAATDPDGEFSFGKLGGGTFRIRFSAAGFADQWYPRGATFAEGEDIVVAPKTPLPLPQEVKLGGLPGSVRGTVDVDEPTGATATLVVTSTLSNDTQPLDAEVQKVDVSADGSFFFEAVPSPARYRLIVDKPGFASDQRDIVLGPAEAVEGIEVVLREGDGVIAGQVSSPDGPLGGVTIEATDGTTTVSTVSLTESQIGFFALRSLPTPGTYTVTVSREGYSSQTITVTLGPAERKEGPTALSLSIAPNTGSLAGIAGLSGIGPAGGVTVTITGGEVEVTTTSASIGTVGEWVVEQLPVPATYTVTFSRDDYVAQTRLIDLDPVLGTGVAAGVDATLLPAEALVRGVVRNVDGALVGGASIVLTDGTTQRRLSSATDPLGSFEFAKVPAGTYTLTASLPGTTSAVVLVNLTPGEIEELDLRLQQRASIGGGVVRSDPQTGAFVPFPGAVVRLFPAAAFPGTPTEAINTTTADADGNYVFNSLDAPVNFVVAVYSSATAGDPLDSVLVQSVPSQAVTVPTFQIVEVF